MRGYCNSEALENRGGVQTLTTEVNNLKSYTQNIVNIKSQLTFNSDASDIGYLTAYRVGRNVYISVYMTFADGISGGGVELMHGLPIPSTGVNYVLTETNSFDAYPVYVDGNYLRTRKALPAGATIIGAIEYWSGSISV